MNKSVRIVWIHRGMGLLLAAILVMIGCENNKPGTSDLDAALSSMGLSSETQQSLNQYIKVDPSTAQGTQVGQVLTFTATGGQPPYHWQVVNGNGSINRSGDNQARYTVKRLGKNTVLVIDEAGHAGTAEIVDDSILGITPSTITLEQDLDQAQFAAVNGLPPFTFFVTQPGLGSITSGGLYTRLGSGEQGVTVVDANNFFATAVVSQPAVSSPVISPASATASSNNVVALVFTVSGGSPPYTWDIGTPGGESAQNGEVNPDSGSTTIYSHNPTPGSPDQVIIRVTDSGSPAQIDTATVFLQN